MVSEIRRDSTDGANLHASDRTDLVVDHDTPPDPNDLAGVPATGVRQAREAIRGIELWQVARGVVQHEDGLVNNRLTWFLTIQGFLFAAYGLGFVNLVGNAVQAKTGLGMSLVGLIWFLLLLIIYLGKNTADFIQPSLDEARNHNARVEVWWKAQSEVQHLYPQLRGNQIEKSYPEKLPNLFLRAWHLLRLSTCGMILAYLGVVLLIGWMGWLPWKSPADSERTGLWPGRPADVIAADHGAEVHALRAEVSEVRKILETQLRDMQTKRETPDPGPAERSPAGHKN